MRKALFGLLSILAFGAVAGRGPVARADGPLTVAEKSEFKATSRYQEVVDFCSRLAESSPVVRLGTLGVTTEGRKLPLIILADPPISSAEEARKSGKMVLYAQGNIHAGECDAKEGYLMLPRDIALARERPLLKDLILVIAPIFNADGNERMSRTNRRGQVGPEEGMGVRPNAQGFDLNRDFVKLESPEVRSLVRFMNQWDPAIVIDGHTTNGSRHRYVITYEGPRSLAGDQQIAKFEVEQLFPQVGARLDKATGFHSFFYGNFTRNHAGWNTVPGTPRYGIHYVGIRNELSVLSESYSYASYKDRIIGSREFLRAIFEFCDTNKAKIRSVLKTAREQTIQAGKDLKPDDKVVLRQKSVALPKKVKLEGYEEGPGGGRGARQTATDKAKDYEVDFYGQEAPVLSVRRPGRYLIPPGYDKAVETLQRHGVEVEVLREDIELPQEAYRLKEVSHNEEPFQGHYEATLEVEPRAVTRRVAAGTYVVNTAQALGDLVVYLLEPQSEDGLACWNFFDAGLEKGSEYPVTRVLSLPPLLTTKARPLAEERAALKPITYDLVYGAGPAPNLNGNPTTILRFLEDGDHFVQMKNGREYKVHAVSGRAEPMTADAPAGGRGRGRGRGRAAEPNAAGALQERNGDLFFAKSDGSAPVQLTKSPTKRKELTSLSPDGKYAAFVQDNNLHVVDVATQTDKALTADGSDLISNGKADWVYYEEIFNRDWRCYWWSPDSAHIAFLRVDEHPVKKFTVVDHIPQLQNVEVTSYPVTGDPNPTVTVGVANAADGKVHFVDTHEYPAADTLFPRPGFLPDSKSVYFYAQNRLQTWLDLGVAPAEGGPTRKLLRNETGAYVEDPGEPYFLKDGSFLLTCEKTGYRHFYHHDKEGRLIRAVTSGPWEVRSLVRVDQDRNLLYFMGMQDDPIGANLYRVKLDGSDMQRLTTTTGDHQVVFSPKANLFVDSYSNPTTPQQTLLRRSDGGVVRILDTNPVYAINDFKLGSYEAVQIRTPDGFDIEGSVLLPPDFDIKKKYPVWFMTYGGPHTPTMRDAWTTNNLQDQLLANMGIVVFRCDPRSASGKGAKYVFAAYKHMGIPELADIETAIKWLCQRPYIDAKRIGMSGHSYGGFMTAFALTHSKLFAAGIAGAPVTDWHNYDTIYTERYMSTPQLNPDGYAQTSVVKAAKDLHGRLLILHGIMDDNVHVQNTVQLINELQKADKDFEVMFYPQARHGIFGRHYNRLMIDFIRRSLGVGDPAKG